MALLAASALVIPPASLPGLRLVILLASPLVAFLPGFRLAILLASPLVAPRMAHKPWAARKSLAPHRPVARTIGLVAVSLIRRKTVSTLVARRRVKGKLEASLMLRQAAQALA